MSIHSTVTSTSIDQPSLASLPEPLVAVFACAARESRVAPGLVSMLAGEIAAVAGAHWSPAELVRLAHALRRAIEERDLPPSQFLSLEDEISRLLVRREADAAQVERVLSRLEDIYIARWW